MDSWPGQVQNQGLLMGLSALCHLLTPNNPQIRPRPLLTGSTQHPWHLGLAGPCPGPGCHSQLPAPNQFSRAWEQPYLLPHRLCLACPHEDKLLTGSNLNPSSHRKPSFHGGPRALLFPRPLPSPCTVPPGNPRLDFESWREFADEFMTIYAQPRLQHPKEKPQC